MDRWGDIQRRTAKDDLSTSVQSIEGRWRNSPSSSTCTNMCPDNIRRLYFSPVLFTGAWHNFEGCRSAPSRLFDSISIHQLSNCVPVSFIVEITTCSWLDLICRYEFVYRIPFSVMTETVSEKLVVPVRVRCHRFGDEPALMLLNIEKFAKGNRSRYHGR